MRPARPYRRKLCDLNIHHPVPGQEALVCEGVPGDVRASRSPCAKNILYENRADGTSRM